MERLQQGLKRHFKAVLIIFSVIYMLQMWLCSGTLAPYAATLSNPHIINDQGEYYVNGEDTNLSKAGCYYIANYDHWHYLANYNFLRGLPDWQWNYGIVHRRPLLFLLSYPLMRMFGFLSGGFIMALLLNTAMIIWFSIWVRKRWGEVAAFCGLLLLTSYPATMYWSGLPTGQILLTSSVLLLTILLYKIDGTRDFKKLILYSGIIGVTFLLYDLHIFFFPAAVLLLVWQRKWKTLPVSILIMALPLAIWLWVLASNSLPIVSENSGIYLNILKSYSDFTFTDLLHKLKSLPLIFYQTLAGASYFFLGVFFALSMVQGIATKSIKLEAPYWVLAASVIALLLFTNLSPDYSGWQLRGPDVARLYQPVAILFILPAIYILRDVDVRFRKVIGTSLVLSAIAVFIINSLINVAPAFGNDSLSIYHYKFYFHSMPETMHENLEKYGRRPLWICP